MTSKNEDILLNFYGGYTGHIEVANIMLSYFPRHYKGILIEVGAAHPELFSIAPTFRDLDWKIISIEPNPEFCEEFTKRNLPVLEYAVCSEDKGTTTFKISPNLVSCSALEVKYIGYTGWTDDYFKTINVEALTLNTILAKHHLDISHIDALIIDTEGWELEVLNGFDLEKFNPKVICLENFQDSPDYYFFMVEKGYILDMKESQDEFYVRTE